MAGGVLSVDNLDDRLRGVLQHASQNYCLFCSPLAAMRIASSTAEARARRGNRTRRTWRA
jgi:hypothetical protein